ncbi:hypothetical protein AMELA_G00176700 [Ameiurus melas]|uniref:Guanylate kinase-like domain-containing protein n=1 Tax=Ameiurus melas TaxID=219545 RepID=A0A7J6AHB5_AMEME|nr:hypothetical protein AMELA_G00176700 [Ameiurus melas]
MVRMVNTQRTPTTTLRRTCSVRFDLDSWGSDETENITGQTPHLPLPTNTSLADDITVVGGNRTVIFAQTVRAGDAERCGLREGSELIELEEVLFSGGRVDLSQCTAEVAHCTLQWWSEPTSLKHRLNAEGLNSYCCSVRVVFEHVRLVKSISSKCQEISSSSSVLYTLSNRHEEHLILHSLVQPVQVECKRPVIFSPSVLSHGLIERLLQPADSGLHFNTCPPEPIPASERNDKSVFLLDHTLGIRLQSIQEVIKQDKHCLLQLSVSSVEALLKQGVYPIIIHIRPKDKKGRKFRKLLSCFGESDVMEVVRVEELQLESLPLMFSTLQPSDWSGTEDLIHTVRHTIHSQQGALVWLEMDRM